ncbi:MAG: hypothetical protein HY741_28710 [Chloroflexi bacterium]|nr:hypothetical protein [Chloroflexota bacterium]
MAVLITFLSLVLIALAGDALPCRFFPRRMYSLTEHAVLGLLLGSGFAAYVLFCSSLVAPRFGMAVTVIAVVAVSAVRVYQLQAALRSDFKFVGFRRTLWLLLPFGLWLVILAVVAFSTDLGFDGLVTWGLKAKSAFLYGGWDISYFTDPLRQVTHQDYPLLVPTLEAWAYTFLARVDEGAVKVIFIAYYAALLAIFYHALRREFSRLLCVIYTLLLALTPYLASMSAISGYADLPLMLFVFSAAVYFRKGLIENSPSTLGLGLILSALGVWVKREGMIFLVFNLGALAVYLLWMRRKALQTTLIFAVPVVLVLAPWLGFLAFKQIPNSDFVAPSLQVFWQNIDRLPIIAVSLFGQFIALGQWGLLWVLFFAISLARWRNLLAASNLYLWLGIVIPITAFSAAFVFSAWQPFTEHLELSMDRLVLQVTPLVWYFIALQLPELDGWLHDAVEQVTAREVRN